MTVLSQRRGMVRGGADAAACCKTRRLAARRLEEDFLRLTEEMAKGEAERSETPVAQWGQHWQKAMASSEAALANDHARLTRKKHAPSPKRVTQIPQSREKSF